MPVDNEGYIFLYRSMLKDALWIKGSNTQKLLMVALVLKANWQPGEWIWQGEKFMVGRGQTITSYQKLRALIGEENSVQQIRTAIINLQKHKFLTKLSTKTGQLITILNYDRFQNNTTKNLTDTQQRPNKDLTPNNTYNNNNKEKEGYIRHGKFVLLKEEEYNKLVKQFGKELTEEKITDLNLGIGSKGYKVKDHYMTILSWDRLEKKRKQNIMQPSLTGIKKLERL